MPEENKDTKQMGEASSGSSSYRSIFKATSLFGGLQVYQILIQIIRSKFVAVLLGPEGMGINGLLQSGTQLIQGFTSLGLSQSAVRDVAEAYGTGDKKRVGRTISVLRKLVWLTGLLGMIVVVLASPLLSLSSFGNYSYTLSFILLSVILLFDQLSAGQKVALQGLRKYKYLAKASAIGITIGLIVSVPLYYFWGNDGIVPVFIVCSLCTLLLSKYYAKKLKIESVKVSIKESFSEGRKMMTLGLVMSLNGILVFTSAYVLKSFISNQGGLAEVGLFNAGFAIVSVYVGMVFNAMSTDYYPRLAAVCNDNKKCAELINRQSEVSILILTPVVTVALIFTPLFLTILFSNKFLLANEYVRWALFGMLFRTLSWSIGNVFYAKGESKLCTFTTVGFNTFFLVDDLLWYYVIGIAGLGISFALNFFIHLIVVYLIARFRYSFKFDKQTLKLFVTLFMFTLLAACVTFVSDSIYKYLLGGIIIILTTYYSLRTINKYIDFKGFITTKLNRK